MAQSEPQSFFPVLGLSEAPGFREDDFRGGLSITITIRTYNFQVRFTP